MNLMIERASGPLPRPVRRGVTSLLAVGLAATALTGCSSSGNPANETTQAPAASSAEATAATGQVVELGDGWAKAADSNMTSVFGSLKNTDDQAVTLESIAAADTADVAELHEALTGAAREVGRRRARASRRPATARPVQTVPSIVPSTNPPTEEYPCAS